MVFNLLLIIKDTNSSIIKIGGLCGENGLLIVHIVSFYSISTSHLEFCFSQ